MWRIAFAAVVFVACAPAAARTTAPSVPASATAMEAEQSSGATAVTTPSTHVDLYGDVRDGRPLATNVNLVVPNDLKPIMGATISVPALGLTATTDARGKFDIDLGEVGSDCGTDVIVRAAGFGSWTYHATPIFTYEHSGGGTRLFVELTSSDQEKTYTHKVEPPRPGCVRVGQTIRGA